MCDFVLRELTADSGGFITALDADSEGEEGKFYRWEKSEVEAALTADEYKLFAGLYGLDRAANFEAKYYVPQLARPLAESAAEMQLTEAALSEGTLAQRLQPIREKLLSLRSRRIRPAADTKILTAENGLMIGGLADCGRILKEPRYIAAAQRR